MAATVSGSKTVMVSPAPHLTAAALTTIMATPVENLTVLQFNVLRECLSKLSGGLVPSTTLGTLLT